MIYETNYNQIKLNDDYDMCCSNYPVNDLEPANPGSNKHFISQLESTVQDPLNLKLVDGEANFPKDTNSVSQLPLHSINDNSSVQNTNLCLIDINNKNKKCPDGWTHTATTIRGYNVCCKNT